MRKNILILGHNDATQFIDIYNQYTRLFDRDRYEVTVAYLTGHPSEAVRQRTLAEKVVFLNLPKKSIRALKISAIRKLLTFSRENNFQLVICHRYKPTYIMLWVARFCKIPTLIFVMHELKTMSALSRQLAIAILKRKNMLFAGVSNAVRDDMRPHLWSIPKESLITLYNVIDIEAIEPQLLSQSDARQALHLPKEAFIFGHIARLVPNKDQASLIHAFSLIKPDCPHAKLIILGDGILETPLKEQVKSYGLSEEVIFTGFVPHAFRYMKAFDCFVLPSLQEAFGRVLLEAMVAKLPIIAARANGIPEVMRNEGLLIPPKDATALAASMKQMYLSSLAERENLGRTAYQRALEHFSIPTFHAQFWQLPLVSGLKE